MMLSGLYRDINDNQVKKTKDNFPYEYEPFVIWKKECNENKRNVVYSDRLMQWDYEKFNNCCKIVWNNEEQMFYNRTPESIEKFLSLYLDEEITLTVIMEGCNVSNGYPYWIFYYESL